MSVAAVILAAGASSRFGKPKQLLVYEGEALVRCAARTAVEAGCAPVIVVIGAAHAIVERELGDMPVDRARNEDWQEGIASSIRLGVARAAEADAVLLMACDQPLVDADSLRQVMELRLTSGKLIVASAYAATLGIPALFERALFPELSQLRGDEGAKRIILLHEERVAAFPFLRAEIDIDTAADWERLR